MLRILERIYVVFALLYFAGGLIPTDLAENEHTQWIDHASIAAQLIVFAVLPLVLFLHRKQFLRAIPYSGWIMVLCGLVVASAAWSAHPLFTLRRAIILLATTVFAIYLGSCFEWDEQLNLFALTIALGVIGSYVIVVLLPSFGISHDYHWGDWKGLFGHKNALGRTMIFGVLLLSIAKPKALPKWTRLLFLSASLVLLLLSKSATAFVLAALFILMYPILHLLRLRTRNTLPLWAAFAPLLAMVILLVAANYSTLLEAVGRDATLTGRTTLWSAVVDDINERPVFGYGYSVFWLAHNPDSANVVTATHWNAPNSHNGYLDLCIDLGLVGLLLFLCGFGVAWRRAVKLFKERNTSASKWPLIFLLFFIFYNVTESNLLRSHTFFWLPYVSTFIYLGLTQAKIKRREPQSALAIDGEGHSPLTPLFSGTE